MAKLGRLGRALKGASTGLQTGINLVRLQASLQEIERKKVKAEKKDKAEEDLLDLIEGNNTIKSDKNTFLVRDESTDVQGNVLETTDKVASLSLRDEGQTGRLLRMLDADGQSQLRPNEGAFTKLLQIGVRSGDFGATEIASQFSTMRQQRKKTETQQQMGELLINMSNMVDPSSDPGRPKPLYVKRELESMAILMKTGEFTKFAQALESIRTIPEKKEEEDVARAGREPTAKNPKQQALFNDVSRISKRVVATRKFLRAVSSGLPPEALQRQFEKQPLILAMLSKQQADPAFVDEQRIKLKIQERDLALAINKRNKAVNLDAVEVPDIDERRQARKKFIDAFMQSLKLNNQPFNDQTKTLLKSLLQQQGLTD